MAAPNTDKCPPIAIKIAIRERKSALPNPKKVEEVFNFLGWCIMGRVLVHAERLARHRAAFKLQCITFSWAMVSAKLLYLPVHIRVWIVDVGNFCFNNMLLLISCFTERCLYKTSMISYTGLYYSDKTSSTSCRLCPRCDEMNNIRPQGREKY